MKQCLTTGRDKTSQKNVGAQIWVKQTKNVSKICFFPFSQVGQIIFPLNCRG